MGKKILCGIMSPEDYMKRTIAIASGKYIPKANEPKVWFESTQTMGQVLSRENINLLRLIAKHKPESLKELAGVSGRQPGNLTRTLKRLERYGIVSLKRRNGTVKPVVEATGISFDISWAS